jgi:hypothetical protein
MVCTCGFIIFHAFYHQMKLVDFFNQLLAAFLISTITALSLINFCITNPIKQVANVIYPSC